MSVAAGCARIRVAVCTFRRPSMLSHLLETLARQETNGLFDYSIVVIDNDAAGSALEAVEKARTRCPVPIGYGIEPVQNISLARNRALGSGSADYYACVDDDEFVESKWLSHLLRTVQATQADGALGPVLPWFDSPPPSWIVEGRIFERESFPTGTLLTDPRQTRSGNFMISRRIMDENRPPFNPEFGRIGGEDSDFFRRILTQGYRLVWCQEARVFESVPRARLTKAYQIRRALMRGVAAAKQGPLFGLDSLRSAVAATLYTMALPVLGLISPSLFLRYVIKDCDHVGKLLARIRIRLVRQWPS